jgi:hypothetical protein
VVPKSLVKISKILAFFFRICKRETKNSKKIQIVLSPQWENLPEKEKR